MKKLDNLSFLIVLSLVVLNGLVWFQIIFNSKEEETQFSFLDVGQGDGTLGVLSGGVKFLVDAGPGAKVISSLEKVLGRTESYIDLALISHPQLDHFGGFNFVLEKYDVGAFVLNGREVDSPEWRELMAKIEEKEIPMLVLGANDKIVFRDSLIDFLSPDSRQLQSAELNDSSLVNLIKTPDASLLLAGDISQNIEKYLTEKLEAQNLIADILKVPHHGSKYSTSDLFLNTVKPKIAVIEVGKNSYGHPTEETLNRLDKEGVTTFRTDVLGTIMVKFNTGKAQVFNL